MNAPGRVLRDKPQLDIGGRDDPGHLRAVGIEDRPGAMPRRSGRFERTWWSTAEIPNRSKSCAWTSRRPCPALSRTLCGMGTATPPRSIWAPPRRRFPGDGPPAVPTDLAAVYAAVAHHHAPLPHRPAPPATPCGWSRSVQIGAVSFLHRFDSALNPYFHFHLVVLDDGDQGWKGP
jgi:hypothetical protein